MAVETLTALLQKAEMLNCSLGEAVLQAEAESEQLAPEDLLDRMVEYLTVMRSSVNRGVNEDIKSLSGLSGGAARLLNDTPDVFLQGVARRAMTYALAVIEVNAAMGKIVAAPTAGSSGILPGVVLAVAEELQADERKQALALFAGAGVGQVIGQLASLSGAEGGCQAECGSASAMAAAAAVELAGGTSRQTVAASALALKNSLGLACDPVAGLVEVPCVKRNAMNALLALGAAELAMAGIESVIPMDEVIHAMGQIGRSMPVELRETAKGGLAQTPTGKAIAAGLFQK